MSIAEKLVNIAEKIQRVFELKDNKPYINSSGLTSLDYFFTFATVNNEKSSNGNNLYTFEKMDTSNVRSWIGTFMSNVDFTELPEFNSDNAENTKQIFYGCSKMVALPKFNFAKSTNASGAFAWCTSMVTIPTTIDFSNVTTLSETFAQCRALKNVTFVEGCIKVSVSFSASLVLTLDSLKSIIKGLYNYKGTENEGVCKLTLHANSKALLEAEGATAPNGLTWLEYIGAKGWQY